MRKPTIVVVDDEPAVRSIVKRLLESVGYRAFAAEDVPAAEALIEEHDPDLVISDYVMPGENGLAFLGRLRDSHPDLIRVLLTGFADVRTALTAINDAHVHHFVVKPFEPDDLLQTVADLLAAFPRPPSRADRPQSVPDLDALARLRAAHPGIDAVRKNTQGYILLDEDGMEDRGLTQEYEAVLELPSLDPEEEGPSLPAAVPKTPQREPTVLRNLKAEFPDIAELRRTKHGRILIDEDELASLFDSDEYHELTQRPATDRAATGTGQPKRPGSDPITDWDDEDEPTEHRGDSPPKRMESEIVFDDSLLKLIGS